MRLAWFLCLRPLCTPSGWSLIRQFPAAKRRHVRRTELRKLVQQLGETFALTLPDLRKSVVWRESPLSALSTNKLSARDPISALTVDQVPDIDKGTERAGTLVRGDPILRQAREHRSKHRRCALQYQDRVWQVEVHGVVSIRAIRAVMIGPCAPIVPPKV